MEAPWSWSRGDSRLCGRSDARAVRLHKHLRRQADGAGDSGVVESDTAVIGTVERVELLANDYLPAAAHHTSSHADVTGTDATGKTSSHARILARASFGPVPCAVVVDLIAAAEDNYFTAFRSVAGVAPAGEVVEDSELLHLFTGAAIPPFNQTIVKSSSVNADLVLDSAISFHGDHHSPTWCVTARQSDAVHFAHVGGVSRLRVRRNAAVHGARSSDRVVAARTAHGPSSHRH